LPCSGDSREWIRPARPRSRLSSCSSCSRRWHPKLSRSPFSSPLFLSCAPTELA